MGRMIFSRRRGCYRGSEADTLDRGSGFDTVVGGEGTDILIFKLYENEWRQAATYTNSGVPQLTGGPICGNGVALANGVYDTGARHPAGCNSNITFRTFQPLRRRQSDLLFAPSVSPANNPPAQGDLSAIEHSDLLSLLTVTQSPNDSQRSDFSESFWPHFKNNASSDQSIPVSSDQAAGPQSRHS